jgi:hypothetical protein
VEEVTTFSCANLGTIQGYRAEVATKTFAYFTRNLPRCLQVPEKGRNIKINDH